MKTKIEEIKVIKEIIESEIKFPFIGWWSNKKEKIIKIYYEYYEHNRKIPKHLKCIIIIQNAWNVNPSITSKTIPVHDGIIDGDIIPILRDYAVLATEKEFQEFREKTLKELI